MHARHKRYVWGYASGTSRRPTVACATRLGPKHAPSTALSPAPSLVTDGPLRRARGRPIECRPSGATRGRSRWRSSRWRCSSTRPRARWSSASRSTAFENAAGIINWEKSSGLFVETSIQQWVLNHIQLAEALNYFYLYGPLDDHAALLHLALQAPPARVYPYVRNAFFVANGHRADRLHGLPGRAAAARRAPATGFVDTLNKVSDIDLHGGVFSGWFNPHAAVPSMHFGYALMIGMVGLVLLRSWPLRLLALAYPALVFLPSPGRPTTTSSTPSRAAWWWPSGSSACGRWMSPREQLPAGQRGSAGRRARPPVRGGTHPRARMSSARSG